MRVLLLSTNRSQIMVPPFPLGLAWVAAGTEAAGHDVEVWDAMFEADWESSLRERLRAFQPDVIGLSVRNVDDQESRGSHFFLEETKQMAEVCHQESPEARGSACSLTRRLTTSIAITEWWVMEKQASIVSSKPSLPAV